MALEFRYIGKTSLDLQGWSTGVRSARKKTDLLRVLLIEDAETTYKELKSHSLLVESMELATAFVVNGIRSELSELRDSSMV
jgi:hypothetical protein